MGLLRYCFEREKTGDNRFEGVPLCVVEADYNTAGVRRETLREVYAIYDRVRGLYDAIAYAPDLEDAVRIVDALNRVDASR